MSWFRKMLGMGASGPRSSADAYAMLARMLRDYPADPPPHPGDPLKLSNAQCDENLRHLLAQRASRLQIVTAFLARHQLDAAKALAGGAEAEAAFAAIDAWLGTWLPKRPFNMVSGDKERIWPREASLASDRSGKDIYLSFFADLALLEGEAIRACDPGFNWEVNRRPEEIDLIPDDEPDAPPGVPSDHADYRHICLVRPSNLPDYWPTMLNLHLVARYQCHAKMSPMTYIDQPYGISFRNAFHRRYDIPEDGIVK